MKKVTLDTGDTSKMLFRLLWKLKIVFSEIFLNYCFLKIFFKFLTWNLLKIFFWHGFSHGILQEPFNMIQECLAGFCRAHLSWQPHHCANCLPFSQASPQNPKWKILGVGHYFFTFSCNSRKNNGHAFWSTIALRPCNHCNYLACDCPLARPAYFAVSWLQGQIPSAPKQWESDVHVMTYNPVGAR